MLCRSSHALLRTVSARALLSVFTGEDFRQLGKTPTRRAAEVACVHRVPPTAAASKSCHALGAVCRRAVPLSYCLPPPAPQAQSALGQRSAQERAAGEYLEKKKRAAERAQGAKLPGMDMDLDFGALGSTGALTGMVSGRFRSIISTHPLADSFLRTSCQAAMAEQQMQIAQKAGKFDNLPGAGKPLPQVRAAFHCEDGPEA